MISYKKNDGIGQTSFNNLACDEFEEKRLTWKDVFLEAAAALASTVYSKAHWTGAGTNGTQAIGSSATMVLDTTTTANSTSTLTGTQAVWSVASNSSMQASLTATQLTNTKWSLGWYSSANDYALFRFDSAVSATNLVFAVKNNGGTEVVTTLPVVPVAGTYNKYRIDLFANGSIHIYVDYKEYIISGTVYTSITNFAPQFYIDNKAVAQSNKLQLDEVKLVSDNY